MAMFYGMHKRNNPTYPMVEKALGDSLEMSRTPVPN